MTDLSQLILHARTIVNDDAGSGKYPDEGTSVLGAGLVIKTSGKRQAFIDVPSYQGNVGTYNVCQRAMQYLKDNGVEVEWYDGVMD